MFKLNVVSEFTVPLPGGKRAKVRYPSDREWCDRAHAIKVVRTSLGRDKMQTEVPGQAKADLDLYERIRKDETPIDAAEAALVFDLIDRCRTVSVEQQDNQFTVVLEVQKATVTHVLRLPNPAEAADYEDGSTKTYGLKKGVEQHHSLEPAGRLYDSIHVSHDGYAGAVPITHKLHAVSQVIDRYKEIISETEIELPEE